MMSRSDAGFALTLLFAVLLAVLLPSRSSALERNFAGSAQFDYHFAPTQRGAVAYPGSFDGFTSEIAFKLAVDLSDHLSANAKVCYGCHGFEVPMTYLDYHVADELTIRVGRMSPSFGAFNLRHDPANHLLSDKPLPYDMGRMLRMRDWNFGVLPSPFPDNGVELNGTHWFGERMQIDYAAYAVTGFKADSGAVDLNFLESRTSNLYYVDNNGRPTLGGRLSATWRLGQAEEMTVGASGMRGTFDPNNELSYAIGGADLSFRFTRTNLRFEYLVRRQEFDTRDPSIFRYGVPAAHGGFFMKHGAYAEISQPLAPSLDLVGRVDGLYRQGNLVVDSPLARRSMVLRYTLGAAYAIERGLRLKASAEAWDFSDVGPNGEHVNATFHLAAVGTF